MQWKVNVLLSLYTLPIYFINTYEGHISAKQLPQVCIVTTNQHKSSENSIPYVKNINPSMLLPKHLKPQKHVYSIVYIFVHIFRYGTWYFNFQPSQQHNIYIFVIIKYTVSNHIGF